MKRGRGTHTAAAQPENHTVNRRSFALALAATLLAWPVGAEAQLKVVTSTTDLADIAKAVGGDRTNVVHISEGYQDPHFVEAKPSFILQLKNADVFAFVGQNAGGA